MAEIDYFTPDELSKKWNVTAQTILNFIKRGELIAYRVGKFYRIPKDVAEDWEKENIRHSEAK